MSAVSGAIHQPQPSIRKKGFNKALVYSLDFPRSCRAPIQTIHCKCQRSDDKLCESRSLKCQERVSVTKAKRRNKRSPLPASSVHLAAVGGLWLSKNAIATPSSWLFQGMLGKCLQEWREGKKFGGRLEAVQKLTKNTLSGAQG